MPALKKSNTYGKHIISALEKADHVIIVIIIIISSSINIIIVISITLHVLSYNGYNPAVKIVLWSTSCENTISGLEKADH